MGLDTSNSPLPIAPNFDPRTRMALSGPFPSGGGGGSLIENAGGMPASPKPDPITSTAQTAAAAAPEHAGFFSRLGSGLKAAMPYLQPALAHVAAAFGNRAPLNDYEQQQQLQTQNSLAQAREQDTAATNALHRQVLQNDLNNYETPDQKTNRAISQAKSEAENAAALQAPKDIVAAAPEGTPGGMAHYNQSYDPTSHGFVTKPTTVTPPEGGNPRQLLAMPKGAGGWETIPDPASPTGYSQRLTDAVGNEIGRRTGAIPPNPLIGSTTSGTHMVMKQDANGNWVQVPETSSSTKVPTLPGVPLQGGGGSRGSTAPQAAPGGAGKSPKIASATSVIGPDGNPLHGPLSADARKNISQITTTEALIGQVMPELEQRIKQSGGDMNSLWDAGKQRLAWQEYKNGGIVPDNVDPALAHLLPMIAQLQIVGGLPYLRGTRSFQYVQQIQQHLPDPDKDSPALMVDKIRSLQKTMPLLRQSVLQSEMNPTGTATGASTPQTMPPTTPSAPTFAEWKQRQPH